MTSQGDVVVSELECVYDDANTEKIKFKHPYVRITLRGRVCTATAHACIEAFKRAERAGQKTLVFEINSPGGEIHAGLQIKRQMEDFQLRGGQIYTFCSVMAASMGAYLFCMGDYRILHDKAQLLFHEARTSGGVPGVIKSSDQTQSAEEMKRINDGLFVEMSRRATQNRYDNLIHDMVKENWNADVYVNAQRAVELGFAHHVVAKIPCLKIKIQTPHFFFDN